MPTRVIEDKGDMTPSFGIDDRIFLGEGLFETIRVNSSKPSFAYMHWERLGNSARQLGIPFEISFDDWFEHLIQKIQKDNLYHGGIKAILSGGPFEWWPCFERLGRTRTSQPINISDF